MQLTQEMILSLIGSALTGAAMAFLGNRAMNYEIWGHIKRHCLEIAALGKKVDDAERELQQRLDREATALQRRLDAHSRDIRELGKEVAILVDRGRRTRGTT